MCILHISTSYSVKLSFGYCNGALFSVQCSKRVSVREENQVRMTSAPFWDITQR
jgi:hypothetical protein